MRILRKTGVIAAPRERIFNLLEDARQANTLNPAYLDLTVLRAPWLPKPGETTLYRARHRGVTFEVETVISEYRRGHFLLERQTRGPFRSLEHAVSLEDEEPGTRLTEVLAYDVGFGLLGRLFDWMTLRTDLERLLATRFTRLGELLELA